MLIISRKKDEKIIVADDIEITILEVGRNRVRFGIKAPKSVAIQTRLKTASEIAAVEIPEVDVLEVPKPAISERAVPATVGASRSS